MADSNKVVTLPRRGPTTPEERRAAKARAIAEVAWHIAREAEEAGFGDAAEILKSAGEALIIAAAVPSGSRGRR